MKLDHLKKSFFGYQKASVYEYITMAEEEFSTKLMEKDTQHQREEEQYRNRIAQLEEELHSIKEQFEQQRNEQMTISAALLEATRYGESLRRQAEEKARQERLEWEEALAAKQRELDRYQAQIQQIRQLFCQLLQEMDQQAEALEQKTETVQASCPGRNMTLFERKCETGA